MALGAFKTSPTASLCAEAAETPFSTRRNMLTSNFLITLSQFPQIPVYQSIFSQSTPSHPTKHILTNLENSINHKLKLDALPPITSSFPPWAFPQPNIRLDLTKLPKTENYIFRQHITKILDESPQHILCLTDGSKVKKKTAYAYSINSQIKAYRIRNSASIYTAELNAILACVAQIAQLQPEQNYLLLTDSLSSLQALTDPFSTNPLIQRIHLSLLTIDSLKSQITFLWIPGHIDFPPHEAVDAAAKQATSLPYLSDPVPSPATDLKTFYSEIVFNKWATNWKQQANNKLRIIKKEPVPWFSSNRESRREEVVLSRLRIGHTQLTHSYIFLNLMPPSCPHCMEDNLTVQHFFTCPALQNIRSSMKIPSSAKPALRNNSDVITKTFTYLRSTRFYEYI